MAGGDATASSVTKVTIIPTAALGLACIRFGRPRPPLFLMAVANGW